MSDAFDINGPTNCDGETYKEWRTRCHRDMVDKHGYGLGHFEHILSSSGLSISDYWQHGLGEMELHADYQRLLNPPDENEPEYPQFHD